MAAPGVRSQDARLLSSKLFPGPLATFWFRKRDKWKQTLFFSGSRSSVWHRKCDQGLDGVKPGRRQVFGAKMREKNGRNYLCSQDPEAAFGSESATRGGSFWTRIRWGKAVAAPGVRGQDAREKLKKTIFVLRIQKRRLAAKVRPGEARFGSELDGVKPWRRQVFGAKMREKNGGKLSLFSGSRSGVWQRGGSFWTRIRWVKAVAAPGVRGQDAREKWKKTICVWYRKCDQGRLVLDQN